jgi:hypothetical protein
LESPKVTADEVADAQKVVEASVTQEQAIEEFGDEHFRRNEKGWRLDFKDKDGRVDMKKLRTFNEMDRVRRRRAVEASEKAMARTPEVTIKGPGGKPMRVPEKHAEAMERRIFERERGRR